MFLRVFRAVMTASAFIFYSFVNPLTFLIDPSRRLLTRLLHFEGILGFALLGLRVRFVKDGFSPLRDKQKRYLFVANHQSMLDISVMYRYCPVPMSFIAKDVLFRIPFLSNMLWATGGLKMHRGNLRKAYQDIRKAVATLKTNRSLLIFPEGTRSLVDEIGPFKPGFLKLAVEAGVDLVPVAIRGTNRAMKKGSMLVDPTHPITIAFGPPVAVSSLPKDPNEAAAHMRGLIDAEFSAMREASRS